MLHTSSLFGPHASVPAPQLAEKQIKKQSKRAKFIQKDFTSNEVIISCNQSDLRKEPLKKFRLRSDSNPGLPDNSWGLLPIEL